MKTLVTIGIFAALGYAAWSMNQGERNERI